jgi:hypothetical protein
MTGLVIAEQCQGPCGRQVPPSRLTPWGIHVRVCDDCRRRHYEALALLGTGKPPTECQNCHTPVEQFKALNGGDEPSFAVHHLDGIYVAICMACSNRIQQLTRHMYRNTPYGALKKLQ